MKWALISFVITMSLLFMYYKTDATNANIEKVLDEQVELVKKKVEVIRDQSSLNVTNENVNVDKAVKEFEITKDSTIELNVSINEKEIIENHLEKVENNDEDIYEQVHIKEVFLDGNIKNIAKMPLRRQCKNNGGEVLSNGDCLAKFNEAQKICNSMDRKLLTLMQMNQVIKICNGKIDSEDMYEHVNNSENKYYQTCYRNEGFAPYEFWTSTRSQESDMYVFVMRFDIADSYLRHELDYAWVRCIRK